MSESDAQPYNSALQDAGNQLPSPPSSLFTSTPAIHSNIIAGCPTRLLQTRPCSANPPFYFSFPKSAWYPLDVSHPGRSDFPLRADSPRHRLRPVRSTLTMTSKLHRNPPFRAEHLGSLLRPDDLLQTRADLDNGKTQQQQLTSIEDTSVKDIVHTQIKLGFHPISDGEYRRHSMFLAYPIHLMSLLTRHGSVLGHLLPWPRRLQGDQEPRRRHLSHVHARHCSLYRGWSQAW